MTGRSADLLTETQDVHPMVIDQEIAKNYCTRFTVYKFISLFIEILKHKKGLLGCLFQDTGTAAFNRSFKLLSQLRFRVLKLFRVSFYHS